MKEPKIEKKEEVKKTADTKETAKPVEEKPKVEEKEEKKEETKQSYAANTPSPAAEKILSEGEGETIQIFCPSN